MTLNDRAASLSACKVHPVHKETWFVWLNPQLQDECHQQCPVDQRVQSLSQHQISRCIPVRIKRFLLRLVKMAQKQIEEFPPQLGRGYTTLDWLIKRKTSSLSDQLRAVTHIRTRQGTWWTNWKRNILSTASKISASFCGKRTNDWSTTKIIRFVFLLPYGIKAVTKWQFRWLKLLPSPMYAHNIQCSFFSRNSVPGPFQLLENNWANLHFCLMFYPRNIKSLRWYKNCPKLFEIICFNLILAPSMFIDVDIRNLFLVTGTANTIRKPQHYRPTLVIWWWTVQALVSDYRTLSLLNPDRSSVICLSLRSDSSYPSLPLFFFSLSLTASPWNEMRGRNMNFFLSSPARNNF